MQAVLHIARRQARNSPELERDSFLLAFKLYLLGGVLICDFGQILCMIQQSNIYREI